MRIDFPHIVPAQGCRCGWHGSFVPGYEHPEVQERWDTTTVCGVAVAWGRVVWHRKGLRSEFMKPVALFNPELTYELIRARWRGVGGLQRDEPATTGRYLEAAATYGCITNESREEIEMWEEVIPYEYRRGRGRTDRGTAAEVARAEREARAAAAKDTAARWSTELRVMEQSMLKSIADYKKAMYQIVEVVKSMPVELNKALEEAAENAQKKGGD
jgi:hypothetical protein